MANHPAQMTGFTRSILQTATRLARQHKPAGARKAQLTGRKTMAPVGATEPTRRYWVIAVLFMAMLSCLDVTHADWPPPGSEAIKLPVTRDNWVSSYRTERDGNNGGSSQLKTKGIQEFPILDINTATLRGRVVVGATLHLFPRSKDLQPRLSVSSLASEWTEGTTNRYRKQRGSSSFNWARQDVQPWAFPGSDITAVINGLGHTVWAFADPTPPNKQGRQVVAVSPDVIKARIAGISHGFVVMDDVGSEYTRNGEAFQWRLFPNRYVASREMGERYGPFFTVYVKGKDTLAPQPVMIKSSDVNDRDGHRLPRGEARVIWATPRDQAKDGEVNTGAIGFRVRYQKGNAFDWDNATPVPRYLIPMAGKPGEQVELHLRECGLEAGASYTIGVRAVDGAGNVGSLSQPFTLNTSDHAPPRLAKAAVQPFTEQAALPRLGGREVFISDALDKLHPQSGKMIPGRPASYRQANHLWSAKGKSIRLHAARNEFVALQVHVATDGKGPSGVAPSITWESDDGKPIKPRIARLWSVPSGAGPLPDPVVPMRYSPPADASLKWASYLVELYVPHQAKKGLHRGKLVLRTSDASLTLELTLHVWDFTLPDRLSFIPQMNCYGLPGDPGDTQNISYYRLAHEHRTCLNRLAYNWRGRPHPAFIPDTRGDWDFSQIERRFGKLFTGEAFKDLPRAGVPIEAFYLPLNENWPMDIHAMFKGPVRGPGLYWIEDAFPKAYWDYFRTACRRFAEHHAKQRWFDTQFEFYLNNKVYHKDKTWSRSSAPWIFDEPVNTQDFWALRAYGKAFHEAVAPARVASGGQLKFLFRGDISRPQWQRDLFDGLLDVNIVGGVFQSYHRRVIERKRRFGEIVYVYGGSNKIETSNAQPVGWCIDVWTLGGDGVLPWQTVGNDNSWKKADTLSLFYPGKRVGRKEPIPSIRLKAYRRGQQDVEYLTILSQVLDQPRWAVGEMVRRELSLKSQFTQAYAEDAGTISYTNLDAVDLWKLRVRVGAMLDAAAPKPAKRLIHFAPPIRNVDTLPDLGYAKPAPPRP